MNSKNRQRLKKVEYTYYILWNESNKITLSYSQIGYSHAIVKSSCVSTIVHTEIMYNLETVTILYNLD